MKRSLMLGILGVAFVVAAPAQAHGFFSFHVGIPGISVHLGAPPPPVYVRSARVYVAPVPVCAPRVIAPPAIVVRPAPVVVVHPRPHRIVVAGPYRY